MLVIPTESLPLECANPNQARSHNQVQNQVPNLFTRSALNQEHKCAREREREISTSEMVKNELLDAYLYPSCVGLLGLPTDLWILLISLFFFLLFIFYSFFLLFLTWPHKQGFFTRALGFLVHLKTWHPSQGLLCNIARVSFAFFGLLMVFT